MKQKLSIKNYLLIGSMLFGLFFGAGNLIFPIFMGQQAGGNVWQAIFGLVSTGVVLPFLGVVAMGLSKTNGLFQLASKVHKSFAYIFTIALYLTIGPFFALPRLATVPYEVGLTTLVGDQYNTIGLAIFSILFFAVAIFYALRPSSIVTSVGKVLNPLFLAFLSILFITAFINPMGPVQGTEALGGYSDSAFFTGFIEGYNTMDALASLAFGVIVINSIKQLGIEDPSQIALNTLKSGVVTLALMAVIYGALAVMGTASLGSIDSLENGGLILAAISSHYFGNLGNILLSVIVILACLKTAIGLIIACSEMFVKMFPNTFSYNVYVFIFGVVTTLIANVGLTAIIAYSLPVLMLLYPLAITLIIISLIAPFVGDRRITYVTSIVLVIPVAIADFLAQAVELGIIGNQVNSYVDFIYSITPFSEIGMGWGVPAMIGTILGIILAFVTKGPHLGNQFQKEAAAQEL
ncbi:MAG TPA: branched-chain amino acid transport system II carrier protein [Alloiococcus sp.]|nr:branched-chain amino acid transport system II carrier protein [Alloiococcus sp.]